MGKDVMEFSENVTILEKEGQTFYIVGTAHVSRESVEEVAAVINEVQPDTIAVACPFCKMMLKDGVNELQIEGVQTKDIAELVSESLGQDA